MDVLREAGWPVYLVLALGIPALGLGLRHVLAPARGQLALVVGFGLACLFSATLGTLLGYDASVEHIGRVPPSKRWIVLVGLKESLRNLEVGLALLTPAALLAAYGQRRLDELTRAA